MIKFIFQTLGLRSLLNVQDIKYNFAWICAILTDLNANGFWFYNANITRCLSVDEYCSHDHSETESILFSLCGFSNLSTIREVSAFFVPS